MADQEATREGSDRPARRDPARNLRRDPPFIEGEARDVTPAAAEVPPATDLATPPGEVPASHDGEPITADDDAPAPAAVPEGAEPTRLDEAPVGGDPIRHPESQAPRQEPRFLWRTLAALGFAALAGAVLYLFNQLASLPPDNSAAVADLKARLAAVESRPATDASRLGDRLTKVEGEAADARTGLAAVGKRLDGLAGSLSAQPDAAGRIAGLQAAVAGLKTDLAAVTSSVAALPRPDVGRIEARLGDLDQRLSTLQGAVSAMPRIDLGPITGKVDALEARMKPLETQADAARSQDQVAQRRAAPIAVTAQAIAAAIEAGQAFPREYQALQTLGVAPAALAPLRAVAENGAPSLRDLQAGLAEVRDRIATQGAAPASGSYMDRLVAGASTLVQVRPLGSVVGDTPSAIAARINDDIGADDLAGAVAEWRKLPPSSQAASKALADRINLRLDAEQAAKAIAADAIGAMAPPRG